MRVFCDNYGCIFIDEYGFCDCDNLSIVGGVCEGSYHNGRNAGAERTCRDKGGIGTKFPATFICSECGWYSPPFAFGEGMPCYCPQCGRRVEQ